ncbi:t-SNARE domain-containing protein 1-like [Lissotriton helveticus]
MESTSEKELPERKRKIKFSTMELQVLVEEVVKEHHKLFGKQSLTVAEPVKRNIWLEIQSKVNAVGMTPRDIHDLKKRWYDLRSLTKKKIAELLKEANKTGGGKNRAPPLTELEELVDTTTEPENVCGLGDADSSARAATRKDNHFSTGIPLPADFLKPITVLKNKK